jgi:hypothetical protein
LPFGISSCAATLVPFCFCILLLNDNIAVRHFGIFSKSDLPGRGMPSRPTFSKSEAELGPFKLKPDPVSLNQSITTLKKNILCLFDSDKKNVLLLFQNVSIRTFFKLSEFQITGDTSKKVFTAKPEYFVL